MSPRKYEKDNPQVQLRIPTEVKNWLAATAKNNGSSMAFEASRRLKNAMEAETTKSKSRANAAS